MLSGGEEREPWSIQAPALEGAIHLAPSDAVKSFHLSGLSPDLLRDVASAYGIRAIVDDSVERKNINFDLENVNYGTGHGCADGDGPCHRGARG